MQHDIRAVTRTTLIATSLVAMFTIGCQDNQAGRKDQGNRPDQKDNAPVADNTQLMSFTWGSPVWQSA